VGQVGGLPDNSEMPHVKIIPAGSRAPARGLFDVARRQWTDDGRQPSARRRLLTVVCLLSSAYFVSPVRAQVKLEWQLQEGKTFFVKRVYMQKQSVEINGKSFKEERAKTWVTAVTAKEKTPAGYVLELKIDSVSFQSAGKMPAGERVGMNAPAQGGLDDALAAKVKGSAFTAVVTAQGKLVKFEGYDAFILKLAGKNAERDKVLRALLTEQTLREDMEDIFHFLPEKAVRKGDKWKRDTIEPVPPFGLFKSVLEYVLDEEELVEGGNAGGRVGISYKIKTTYKPPNEAADLIRIVKGSLKAEEGKGSIIFDVKQGRLVRSEKTAHIRGDLVIESMGKQMRMEFSSENAVHVEVYTKEEAGRK
jgi:hypothetical protein